MRKSRIISALLCICIIITCLVGCGASADYTGTGDEINASDDTDENVMITEDEGAADARSEDDGRLGTNDQHETDEVLEGQDETAEEKMSLEGLGLSILGDSISTYDGYIPEGYVVYYPFSGEVTDVSQTWWMRLMEDTGMELCANGSSSGSTCIGDTQSIDDPKDGCSGYRISALVGKQGRMPDVIIVYMGTNDLLIGIELGDNDGTKIVEDKKIRNFSDAYTLILDELESNYPAAQIYCCTLAQIGDWGTDRPFITFTNNLGLTSEDYSERIRVIADNKGIPVIDLINCGIEIDNLHEMTTDGVHMTPDGMECVERAVLSGMGFTYRKPPL